MPAGQNHSNFALNTRLSAPRYDTWCKIQVINLKLNNDKYKTPVFSCGMDIALFKVVLFVVFILSMDSRGGC